MTRASDRARAIKSLVVVQSPPQASGRRWKIEVAVISRFRSQFRPAARAPAFRPLRRVNRDAAYLLTTRWFYELFVATKFAPDDRPCAVIAGVTRVVTGSVLFSFAMPTRHLTSRIAKRGRGERIAQQQRGIAFFLDEDDIKCVLSPLRSVFTKRTRLFFFVVQFPRKVCHLVSLRLDSTLARLSNRGASDAGTQHCLPERRRVIAT